ncbi:mechanosensitive ion channel family protein [Ideonella sp.]|uniref:mechanosensitive ion channel family protein n=1 Tax=Ideonella sp. TaxID=1929293 RepID=UPI0035ADA220
MNWTALEPWGNLALLACGVLVVAQLAHRLLRPVLRRMAGWSVVAQAVLRRCDRPAQALLPLIVLQLVWQGAPDDLPGLALVQHINGVLLILSLTLLGIGAIRGLADGVIARHPADVADNLAARRIHTQARVLSRIAGSATLVTGLALVLMTFPRARQFGTSLLASAGVAGLVVGIAAKSVFSNLLAGLQIALAQPLRIDDVLIVEGEWGRVEEITATYVVLRIWDERRLVIPLSWFIEHPFQNWTRTTADLLGTVFLWVDFTASVDAVRAEARRLCEASQHWDGKVCLVQVTDTNDQAMQLRVLVSSAASGPNFDLRCEVREGLLSFLARTSPQSLPLRRLQAEVTRPRPAPAP